MLNLSILESDGKERGYALLNLPILLVKEDMFLCAVLKIRWAIHVVLQCSSQRTLQKRDLMCYDDIERNFLGSSNCVLSIFNIIGVMRSLIQTIESITSY